MERHFVGLRHIIVRIGRRWFLLGGLGYWFILLGLSLIQAWNEAVIFSTPYGDYFLRILIIPISGVIIFFIMALFRPEGSRDSRLGNSLILQVFLLILIILLSYWALRSLLQANWLVLLGVLLLLPLLYLGGVGFVNQNTLISLLAIAVMFVGLELFLQAVPQIWPPLARTNRSNWGRVHAGIPFHEEKIGNITYRNNELGFRGTPPVPSQVDLVALGDSFTYGISTARPWPEVVAQKLDWQVLNLGINGSSPPTLISPLTAYGLPRQPRVVIYAYFEGNDFYPCDQPPRPQGARWGDKLIVPDYFRVVDVKISQWFRPPRITSAITYDVVTPSELIINGHPVEVTFAPAYVATLTIDRPSLGNSENWRIVTQSLLQMRDLVEAENSLFLLVYIPERTRVYWPIVRENLDVVNRIYTDQTYQWALSENCLALVRRKPTLDEMAFRDSLDATIDEQQKLMATFAADNNILFLDLTEPLRIHAAQGTVLAQPLETHYNDNANIIMGTVIADYITSHIEHE